MPNSSHFVDAETVARVIGTHPGDVLARALNGELPSRTVDGRTLFLLADVLRAQKVDFDFIRTQRMQIILDPFASAADKLRAINDLERSYLTATERGKRHDDLSE